jgi:HUS1 checkpoint protein
MYVCIVYKQVSVYMPTLKVLRNVVDRMKSLSNFVRVSACNSGKMKLCVETELVSVTTYFRDLSRPAWRKFISNIMSVG